METQAATRRRTLFEQLRAEIRGEMEKPARNLISHDWERMKFRELRWAKARVQKRPIVFRKLEVRLKFRHEFSMAVRPRITSVREKWLEAAQGRESLKVSYRGGRVGGYRSLEAAWQRQLAVRTAGRDRERD